MATNELTSEREPADKQEVIARCKWRTAIGTDKYDSDFWTYFDKLPGASKADSESIALAGLRLKPSIEAGRRLASQMSVARRRFLGGGGSETEWEEAQGDIRKQLLKDVALGRPGMVDEREEKIRRARESGLDLHF